MMKKIKILGLIILTLTLLGDWIGAADTLIEPGIGVGKIKLQHKLSDIEKIIGAPSKIYPSSKTGHSFCYYKNLDMALLVEKETVAGITVFSSKYKLNNGIGVGKPQIEVIRTYRQEKIVQKPDGSVIYPEVGIGFSFENGAVSRIYVVEAEKEK
jgi:hypothetical protein